MRCTIMVFMEKPSSELRVVMGPLVDDLRRGLRELESGELSPALRRVVNATGRRLPPPLLVTLIEEVERSDWLRERLAEELEPDPGSPLHGYLTRPDGWWFEVIDRTVALSGRDRPDAMAGDVAKLETRLSEAKRRTAALREQVDRLEAESRALRHQLETAGTAAVGADEIAALTGERDELSAMVEAGSEALQDAEMRITDLMRRAKEKDPPPEQVKNGPTRVVGALHDPVGAARRLDLTIASLAAGRRRPDRPAADELDGSAPDDADAGSAGGAQQVGQARSTRLSLPPGIRPDTGAAVDWLFALDEAVTVLVDGYNVTYLMEPSLFATGELRRRLIAGLRVLRRQTGAPHRLTVVFDSTQAPAEPEVRPGGIEVRFTTAGVKADDEIVELVSRLRGHPVVVISDDRDVRERADDEGALTLWSGPLAARLAI